MIAIWSMSTVRAAVLHVGVGQPHPTVADAVAAASDGDLLVVHDAVVAEEVTIDGKRLAFRTVAATTWAYEPVTQIADVVLVNGADATFVGFTFDGAPAGWATAIYVDPTSRVVVADSRFLSLGSSVLVDGGSAEAIRSTFRFHVTTGEPALRSLGGDVRVLGSRFADNMSGSGPSAILAEGGTLEVRRSRFERNYGGPIGGAVQCGGATCSLSDNVFVGNTSSTFGAAVASFGDLTIVRDRYCANDAQLEGAVAVIGGTASIRNSAFLDNTDIGGGAAIVADQATVELVHDTFVGNTSILGPGGMLFNDSTLTMVGTLVTGTVGVDAAFADYGASAATTSWGAWFDNAPADASFALGASDLVGVDPLLSGAGPACSWARVRPLAGSPLVDGDPTLLDRDGSDADIGATGGPEAP